MSDSLNKPGPLGRLVKERRLSMGITQIELSELTARHGAKVPQTVISRLESGKTQRMNNAAYLNSLAKALNYEDNEQFIIAAYGPKDKRDAASEPNVDRLPPAESAIVKLMHDWPETLKVQTLELLRVMDRIRSESGSSS